MTFSDNEPLPQLNWSIINHRICTQARQHRRYYTSATQVLTVKGEKILIGRNLGLAKVIPHLVKLVQCAVGPSIAPVVKPNCDFWRMRTFYFSWFHFFFWPRQNFRVIFFFFFFFFNWLGWGKKKKKKKKPCQMLDWWLKQLSIC